MMQLHLDEISRNVAEAPFSSSTGPDGTRRASSTCPTTSRRSSCLPAPGAEPGRERLAVPPPELALKHRLRKLRRDRRRRMRGLAKAHRSTRNDHLHRKARLGSRRSAAMTLGISGSFGDQTVQHEIRRDDAGWRLNGVRVEGLEHLVDLD